MIIKKSCSYLKTLKAMKKETWKTIIHIIVSIVTALATSIGVTSCTL